MALLALLVSTAASSERARAREVPALQGPVVDEAGLLDARDRERLGALCRSAWALPADRRVQLQYLLLDSLEGEDIADFSTKAFEAYKLGDRDRDNGVLLVVSRQDRRVKIETGYGTEGALTDVQASRIIRNTLAPAFRQGRYGEGLYEAGVEMLSALGALPQGATGARPVSSAGRQRLSTSFILLLFLLVLALRVFTGFGPRRRFFGGGFGGPWGGGLGRGGWGGGGWGGGGGGWGGGGGRSGGGGASGGW